MLAVVITLQSGTQIPTEIPADDLAEPEEVLADLCSEISGVGPVRPHWRLIGDALVFTGAVSSISPDPR